MRFIRVKKRINYLKYAIFNFFSIIQVFSSLHGTATNDRHGAT